MKDDAVAPVIAVMLILAAIVTFLSFWNAVYVPSQKQASEIEHIRNVESAFLHFSSDIGDAVTTRKDNLMRSEPVQLGGGDCLSSTLRSGGSLSVMDEPKPVYSLTLYDESLNPINQVNGTLVNISYEPVGNFWQDQGYRWQHGFINVTKHRTLQSPLDYSSMAEVNREFNETASLGTFARSFGSAEYTINQSATRGNCSRIVLNAVRLSATPDHPFISGNGFGTFKIISAVNMTRYDRVAAVSVLSDHSLFGNASLEGWNASLAADAVACSGSISYVPQPDEGRRDYLIGNGKEPVDLILNDVLIEIGVY